MATTDPKQLRTTSVEADTSSRTVSAVTNHSPPEAKIALFCCLFRGREDVYPRRFENRKTGKSGYSPACGNEWVRGVCEKPRIKCSDCPHQHFLPVTYEIIRWHLSGRDGQGKDFVLGVYPMLLDETCFFLAVDFDGSDWKKDAGAFIQTCRERKFSVALERSRSGEGAHVWFPAGTREWIAEYLRLLDRCVINAKQRNPAEVREAMGILFGRLNHIDQGHDVIFFSDGPENANGSDARRKDLGKSERRVARGAAGNRSFWLRLHAL